jgi:hypothetical protein
LPLIGVLRGEPCAIGYRERDDVSESCGIVSIAGACSVHRGKEYAPQLVKVKHSGEVHLLTRMSRLLGKPPVMVAGMTPTTVNPQLVSAVMNAGVYADNVVRAVTKQHQHLFLLYSK